jgi:hypothetical protein
MYNIYLFFFILIIILILIICQIILESNRRDKKLGGAGNDDDIANIETSLSTLNTNVDSFLENEDNLNSSVDSLIKNNNMHLKLSRERNNEYKDNISKWGEKIKNINSIYK